MRTPPAANFWLRRRVFKETKTNNPQDMDKKINPADIYPGVAPDVADNESADKREIRDDVKELNDNPRDTDLEMP